MSAASFLDAIVIDEIGIESGAVGDFRIRSAYRPVFSPLADNLAVTAFDAVPSLHRGSEPADVCALHAAGVDADFAAGLVQTLNIRNHRNIGQAGAGLILDHTLPRNRQLRDILRDAACWANSAGEEPLAADQVLCRLSDVSLFTDPGCLARIGELRDAGFGVMLDAFDHDLGAARSRLRFKPDVAEIGASWFGKIAARGAAARLLAPLVEAHRSEGIRVHIRGISTAEHLDVAIASGAEYLSGDYLGAAAAVGTPVADEPRPVADLLPHAPAFARRPG